MGKFIVTFIKTSPVDKCPMINIDTPDSQGIEDFSYTNIYCMYKTTSTQGIGIQ